MDETSGLAWDNKARGVLMIRGNVTLRASASNRLLGPAVLVLGSALLAGCGSSSPSTGGGGGVDLPLLNNDSAAVTRVKEGTIKACPLSTLGEMADAFFPDPEWRDFTSDSGKSVVELSGSLTYGGKPATAMIQFVVDPMSGFEAKYVEINGVAGNLLELSALLTKMCDAT